MAGKNYKDFRIIDRALEIAGYRMGSKILDIGCGEGDTVDHMNSMGIDAEGIDINLEAIRIAGERFPGLRVKFGDGSFLEDYMSFTFDGAIFEDSLGLINQPDEALHEAYCTMKKGGRLIVTDVYEVNPDPKQVKAVKIEAQRQARIPHQEGDCDEGTTMRYVDFRYGEAFFREPLVRMLEEEIGFRVLTFEDCGTNESGRADSSEQDDLREKGRSRFILVAQKPIV